jgi:hypothetical protein
VFEVCVTTPRACRACGESERRWRDKRGRRHVNLDPVTGLCVDCLSNRASRSAALARRAARPDKFDARAAAARNDD